MRLKQKQVDKAFGPADSSELLLLISSILPALPQDELLQQTEGALTRYPLSHNLRVFAMAVFDDGGRFSARDALLARTLGLYPDSPILLQLLLKYRGQEMAGEERAAIEMRVTPIKKGLQM